MGLGFRIFAPAGPTQPGRTAVLLVLIASLACACKSKSEPKAGPAVAAEPAAAKEAKSAPKVMDQRDLLLDLPFCEVRHRGIAIDPGSTWSQSYRSFHFGPFDDVEPTTRAGSSAGRVKTRKLSYSFWLDRPAQGAFISFRAQGESARSFGLYLDGRHLAGSRLSRDGSKVHTVGPLEGELSAGRHTLTFRFSGGSRAAGTPVALLDWIRIYLPDNDPESYLPPVERNLLQDVVLSDAPRRALAMRPPSDVRCSIHVVDGLRVLVDVGYWGVGEGVAQVRALTSDNRSIVLAERKVSGGEDSKWTPLDLALDAFAGQLVGLEFASVDGVGAGRVVFGEPRLVRERAPSPSIEAQNVVLVIAGGTHRRLFPPWESREGRSALFELVNKGVVFDGYRVGSTLVSSVVASLLTGLPPSVHKMLDPVSRLPESALMISEALHESGGRSAFFTNVPYSFERFNFNKGWHEFQQFSPVEDRPASEPFTLGSKWLRSDIEQDEERKRLLVFHVRGGHPPWDVSEQEAQGLAPGEYNGIIDPRRGATVLRDIRNRTRASRRKLGPDDLARMHALQDLALRKQDAGLGQVIRALAEAGQLKQTLFVFVGDVAMGDPPGVPFVPLGKLQASRLMPPLIVKFPGDSAAGKRNMDHVSPMEVARTLYSALGLKPPKELAGPHLYDVLQSGPGLTGGEVLARQGARFAYFAGRWRLRGALGSFPQLCNIEVDPACETDLFETEPQIAHWMWRNALKASAREKELGDLPRENAELDDFTRAALTVYGL